MAMYFKIPFGASGDKTAIPDTSPPDGSVSYTAGFGVNYQLDPASDSDALNIPRLQFNEMVYQITLAMQQYQQKGFPDFITSADNGGSPYSYSKNATVRAADGNVYYSLVNSNTTTPPSASWGLVAYSQGVAAGTTEIWPFNTLKSGGYVWLNGTTIGNATSNATQRANADTQTIFELLWNDYSNAVLPLLTSGGVAVTRGVSAAADYALNRQLTLPDACGSLVAFMDNMGGIAAKNRITTGGSGISGVTLGARGGAQNVALTSNQNGQHFHTGNTNSNGAHFHGMTFYLGSSGGGGITRDSQVGFFPGVDYTTTEGEHAHSFTTSSSGLGEAHQNMPPTVMLGGLIMKL